MPWQLIYTSAPRLLTAGQTGFGTVARHQAVPPLVVSAVERASQFARLPGMNAERVVFCHRIVDAAGSRHHVLSRIANAGADYTGRTNHLAHHVILTAAEVPRLAALGVSAADVLLRFPWRSSWSEAPRWLEENETPDLAALPVDRQEHLSVWTEATGNPQHANHLVNGPGARGCMLIVPPKVDARRLYGEALRAVPEQGWQFPFTTELDPGDEAGDFRWLGFSAESPLLTSFQPGRRLVLDLTKPGVLPIPEPLPEKPRASAATVNRTAPPKVAAPAGGAFVEPPPNLPPPDLVVEGTASAGGDLTGQVRRGRGRAARHEGQGWRTVVVVVLMLGVALVASRFVTDALRRGARSTTVGASPEAAPEVAVVLPEAAPGKPAPPVSRQEPSSEPARPPQVPAAAQPPPAQVIPLRVAMAAKLATVALPELRVGQTHLLITDSGEERGPLNEARNNLWVSLADKSPTLKLDYAAKRAEWSAGEDAAVTPPVQWRILQDNREVLRVLIGGSGNTRPVNAAPLQATQDEGGVFSGDLVPLMRRLGDHVLWLRLPEGLVSLLRECGYPGQPIVPIRDLRADTSDIISWVVKEQTKVKGVLDAPFVEPPLASTAPVETGFAGKAAAPVSDQVNRLGNRAAPTSSVAGNAAAEHGKRRADAEQRMAKLNALRGHPILQARFASATCPFLAGPAASTPAEAVWICNVVFAPR